MFRTKKKDITLDLKNAEKQLRKLNKTIEDAERRVIEGAEIKQGKSLRIR